MALPLKVADQLSRAPARTPGWSSRVLLFSITFFVLSLAIFLGIQFGYEPFLENQIEQLDRDINEFSKQVPQQQQDQLISFYSQLDNMSVLLARQTMPSKIFGWFEANTNTSVQLTSLSFNAGNKNISILGQARTITSLGQQLNQFKNQPVVKNTQLTQLALDPKSGTWNFTIILTFDPQFFVADQATASSDESSDAGPINLPPTTSTSSATTSTVSAASSSTTSTAQ